MRFYRLEKENYFKTWAGICLKMLFISFLLVVSLMIVLGYKFLIVVSPSMTPLIPVGSLVIVTPCEYEDLELGDIVTMDKNGVNLTHRVKGKCLPLAGSDAYKYMNEDDPEYDKGVWYSQGDASDTKDGPVDGVIGVVQESHIFEFTGKVVNFVQNHKPLTIIVIVLVVATYCTVSYLKSKLIRDDIECYDWEEE